MAFEIPRFVSSKSSVRPVVPLPSREGPSRVLARGWEMQGYFNLELLVLRSFNRYKRRAREDNIRLTFIRSVLNAAAADLRDAPDYYLN